MWFRLIHEQGFSWGFLRRPGFLAPANTYRRRKYLADKEEKMLTRLKLGFIAVIVLAASSPADACWAKRNFNSAAYGCETPWHRDLGMLSSELPAIDPSLKSGKLK